MSSPFSKHVVSLTPDDFQSPESWKLKPVAPSGRCHKTLVLFHVDWCGWCQQMKPDWNSAADFVAFCRFAEYNCESYPDHYNQMKTDVPDMFKGFPTIVVYDANGEPVHMYEGERTKQAFVNLCMRVCQSTASK